MRPFCHAQDQYGKQRASTAVYAIVKAGGRQEKVSTGDVFQLDRVAGNPGSTLELPAVLLVDGATVTSDAAVLANVKVTAEVLAHTKGPKIKILHYKNKSGHRTRQGHRQKLTQVKITSITS
jgi:large subunit ribosomal protein L21